jgi:hypothetical protein
MPSAARTRPDASRTKPAPSGVPRWRRLPWFGIAATVLVLAAGLVPTPAIRDAVTLDRVREAYLTFTPAFLAFSPLWDVLDALTLLSVRDHVALLVWLVALYVAWRVLRRRGETTVGRVRREAGLATLFLALLVIVYAVGALVSRPMARLEITIGERDQVIVVDVHAHTQYSHDGRPGWTPEDVRDWHRGAGFDAAFISDHRTMEGIERAFPNNPTQAGQATVLLPALEVVYGGAHVNILNVGLRYRGITTESLRDMDAEALALASLIPNSEPVIVHTIPGDLAKLTPAQGPGTAGSRAIEIIDGAPRGLGQGRQQRARIVKLADSLNLALVAGSDNHGWGRTAPGWTLLRLPGWRGMPPDSLGNHIDRILRLGGRRATLVVARTAGTGDAFEAVVFALPVILWRTLATLSTEQRVMWVLWIWIVVLSSRATRMWRRQRLLRA